MSNTDRKPGITQWGVYLPRRRLERTAIAAGNLWFDAGLRGLARGQRTMCNWDEDSLTMAVEAGRDALSMSGRGELDGLYVASTTFPFLDRHNAGVVAEALNLKSDVRTLDAAGVQRAGTNALLAAADGAISGRQVMVVASEHRRCRVGSAMEMLSGDGAAAIVLGTDDVKARLLDSTSITSDFIDHYRTAESQFDYGWEERWVRDEGYLKLVPEAIDALLKKTGVDLDDVTRIIVPTPQARVPGSLAKALGVDGSRMADLLIGEVGDTGVAHPLLMLAHALDTASAGDRILLIGFGQGVDALLFEATDAISEGRSGRSVQDWIDSGVSDDNYARFQTFNGTVDREFGKRAETDTPVRPSAHYRNRKTVNSFIGGRCKACDTIQFPQALYCVNPECGAAETQVDYPLADASGKVVTYTADRLTFAMDPPAYFGLVEFEGGARTNLDFTEVEADNFDVGTPVSLHFRIKQFDTLRGFRSYFWKAAPTG